MIRWNNTGTAVQVRTDSERVDGALQIVREWTVPL